MDAWASPWADDAHQDEDPGHRRTVSTLQDFELFGDDTGAATEHTGVDGSLAFTSKLDDSDFGGASIWATDVNAFGGVDSSSAWASDSTGVPLPKKHCNGVYPNWGDNDIVSGETQITGSITIANTSISPEGTLSSQARRSTPSITTSTKEFSDDWLHKTDWSSTAEDQPTAEALPTVLDAHQEKSGGRELQSDSPFMTAIVMTEEQPLASALPEEKAVETLPTSFLDQCAKEQFVQGEDSTETVETVSHKPLIESDESTEVVGTEKPENGSNVENNRSGILPEEQEGDDDFGDFGDAEEGEIEDVKFETEPVPAPVAAAITHPLTPLDFTIDSSLALKLYPVMQKKTTLPPVEDIISTTSTRKAWYRISRVGTARKHNSGEGDDYVRVTWSKSKVRADVCDIVNRWIKEGRFSISDAIGLGRSYGAIFGWGDGANTSSKDSGQKGNRSSAPTVLGLTGYKEGTKSTHKASVSISSWDPPDPGKFDASSTVDFGWGSPKESKPEMTATKFTTSPKKEQILPSVLLSTSSNSISPETTNALKVLAASTTMKPQSQTLKASTEPGQPFPKVQHIGKVAPKGIIPEQGNWEDFEATPMKNTAAVPEMVDSGRASQSLVSDPGTWASLELFEKGNVSHATHASPPTSLDSDLCNLGLYFGEQPEKQPTMALEFGSAVKDDDWGEMISSPATPVNPPPALPISTTTTTTTATIKNRRPSTAQGQTNSFGEILVGVLETTNVAPVRRDSAPTLVSPINVNSTMSGAVPKTENNSATTVDWDFSVFERPATKDLITTSSAVSQASVLPGSTLLRGPQVLSKEDKVAMDILEGLPDMGYMLR
ncbi:hypothetical protein EV426DRAFT_663400 [Tirmania nivea]|nr:hypothetical protein EV426DRAFT_663400 [Tirmania nivea]